MIGAGEIWNDGVHSDDADEYILCPGGKGLAILLRGGYYESYVVLLKLKASPMARRAPMDLLMVLDVGGAISGAKIDIFFWFIS